MTKSISFTRKWFETISYMDDVSLGRMVRNMCQEALQDTQVKLCDTHPIWWDDVQVYYTEAHKAATDLLHNQAWIGERQSYHPSLNVTKSVQKVMNDYWLTPEGWKKKKASRVSVINWERTLNNALTIKVNQVYAKTDSKTK